VLKFYLLHSRVSTCRIKNPSEATSGREKKRERKKKKKRERERKEETQKKDRKIGNRPWRIMDSRLE